MRHRHGKRKLGVDPETETRTQTEIFEQTDLQIETYKRNTQRNKQKHTQRYEDVVEISILQKERIEVSKPKDRF